MAANAIDEAAFASCAPGLEPVLAAEARALGAQADEQAGGVELSGPAGLHRRANLALRTAGRVLLRLARFQAQDARELRTQLQRVDLARVRVAALPVALSVSVSKARWRGPPLEETVAEAWRLDELPPRPNEERADEEQAFHLRVDGSTCELSVDTSGAPLYRRGYRQEVSRAPMRETLAAGILGLAAYSGDEPLIDPMCGSGTLLIEGAWLSMRRAPGSQRTFAFERWPSHDTKAWTAEKAAATAAEAPAPRAPIHGADLNAGSLGTARRNARRAGLTLALERLDATAAPPPRGVASGLVVANLPYGKRVGEAGDLGALYRGFGENLKRQWRGFRIALFIPDEDRLARLLPSERSLPLQNGGLRCRLLLGRIG